MLCQQHSIWQVRDANLAKISEVAKQLPNFDRPTITDKTQFTPQMIATSIYIYIHIWVIHSFFNTGQPVRSWTVKPSDEIKGLRSDKGYLSTIGVLSLSCIFETRTYIYIYIY